jgi:hypothetical protein
VGWIGFDHDRSGWKLPQYMLVTLQVLQKAGNFRRSKQLLASNEQNMLHDVCFLVIIM